MRTMWREFSRENSRCDLAPTWFWSLQASPSKLPTFGKAYYFAPPRLHRSTSSTRVLQPLVNSLEQVPFSQCGRLLLITQTILTIFSCFVSWGFQVTVYMFYKNALLVLPQFFFAFLSLSSGQNFYYDMLYQSYNVLFTGFPIIALGVLDQAS